MSSRRFLAAGGRSGNGHGYLSQPERQLPMGADPPDMVARIAEARAMCDEPEAPSPSWVDAESELAAERNRLRLLKQAEEARAVRRGLTVESRIRDVQRRAKANRVDVGSEVYVIRRMLTRRNASPSNAAVERLEKLEARLDGVVEG